MPARALPHDLLRLGARTLPWAGSSAKGATYTWAPWLGWQQYRSLTSSCALRRFDPTVRARATSKASTGYQTCQGQDFDKAAFEALLQRRQFLWPSFEPYGSTKGLFDYGPPLEGLENEVLRTWRDHFIRAEQILAIKCPILTPYQVLKASGHVDKFADLMCKDSETGEMLRADHLIRDVLTARLHPQLQPTTKQKNTSSGVTIDDSMRAIYEAALTRLDNCTAEDLADFIADHNICNPASGNTVEPPIPVNLMFKTQIGPTGDTPAFLRPETAQGQFLAFQRLLKYNNGRLPFASATIGHAFRNEISPRSSLLRVREFLMAEVEHFVDPDGGKKHERFATIAEVKLPLLCRAAQTAGTHEPEHITMAQAVESKLVDNETLAYFLARIYQFMQRIGIDTSKLRFRQHLSNEMAHYATDCWDCELLTSHGWIECVGCADRSAYDLDVHARATGHALNVTEALATPYTVEECTPLLNKALAGPRLKSDARAVEAALQALPQADLARLRDQLARSSSTGDGPARADLALPDGRSITLTPDLVSFPQITRTVTTRTYTPHVIEPSFGVGRILYALLEHSYWTRREDPSRAVLSFLPTIAPCKVLLTPLQRDARFEPVLAALGARFDAAGLSYRVDRAAGTSIGKRYSRNDELGVPLAITVDYGSVDGGGGVTLRERDSTAQVRGGEDEVVAAVVAMASGRETWEQVAARLAAA